MTTWVVMEVTIGSTRLWAWGKVTAAGPGFDEVYYTERDGITPAELTAIPQMGAHLFTVTVEEEVVRPVGDKFREEAAARRAELEAAAADAASSPDGDAQQLTASGRPTMPTLEVERAEDGPGVVEMQIRNA